MRLNFIALRKVKDQLPDQDVLTSLVVLLKGGIPATPSGTATLLRLSPSHWFYPNEVFYLPLQVYPTPMA